MIRILQLSDIHFHERDEEPAIPGLDREDYAARLAHAAREIPSDLVVLSGDLAHSRSSDAVYGELRDLLAGVGRPVVAMPGNHDAGVQLERFFPLPERVLSRGPESCFALERQGRRLLFLDSSAGVVGETALHWLAGELQAQVERHYLFMHHPPMLAGARYMDRKHAMEGRRELAAVLDSCARPVAVFCGHYHCARELVRNRVAVHVTPSTLFQIDPEPEEITIIPSPVLARLIEIGGEGYRTWIREAQPTNL